MKKCVVYQNSLISYLRINIQPWGATNSSRRLLIIIFLFFYASKPSSTRFNPNKFFACIVFFTSTLAENRVNDTQENLSIGSRRSGNNVVDRYGQIQMYSLLYIIQNVYIHFFGQCTFCVFYRIFIHLSYFVRTLKLLKRCTNTLPSKQIHRPRLLCYINKIFLCLASTTYLHYTDMFFRSKQRKKNTIVLYIIFITFFLPFHICFVSLTLFFHHFGQSN